MSQDTEFPGVVARPMGNFTGKADYHYQTMRCNADLLKIIQLGITIFSDDGDSPPASISAADLGIDSSQPEFRGLVGKFNGGMIQLPLTLQFNFKFSLKEDMYNEVAIESLKQAGVDFQRLEVEGIDPFEFGALLMSSGLVCDEDVHWISFHSAYDFGYLTKLLLRVPLPDIENDFDRFMKKFFPSIYDIKYLLKHAIRQHQTNQLTPMDESTREILVKFEQKSGLDNLAESLKIKRQGLAHQAGSDALLTGKVFFRLRERLFNGEISDDHQSNLWGLTFPEQSTPQSNIHSTPQHYNHQLQENISPGQNGYSNGAPSTPNTGNAGLASTPGHHNNGVGMGPLTPGGAGGVFGAFQYNSK